MRHPVVLQLPPFLLNGTLEASVKAQVDCQIFKHKNNAGCCGQLWVRHMFCGRDLWWTIPLHIFHWSCWDTLWIPTDHMDLINGPLSRVRFGESLVFRLYSEIDHLHLSSEAQCVSHLLPSGDCHTGLPFLHPLIYCKLHICIGCFLRETPFLHSLYWAHPRVPLPLLELYTGPGNLPKEHFT